MPSLGLQRCFALPLLVKLGLFDSLSCNNSVVLGPNFIAVLGNSVRLLGRWPEARDGEALLDIRSEIVHDPNGEREVCAELMDCR